MAAYQEGGMVLVVGMMFVYLVVSMSKKNETQQQCNTSIRWPLNIYTSLQSSQQSTFQ